MKKLILIFLLLTSISTTYAQEKPLSILGFGGIGGPLLDSGISYYAGLNPSYRLSQRFSLEGQLSYLFTNINSTFLSGNMGTSNTINTVVGGRLYLMSEEKKTRLYINTLLGLSYTQETINNIVRNGDLNIGFSGGVFIDRSNLVVGVSFDALQFPILKLGYTFI